MPTDKWTRQEMTFTTDFDLPQTELVALAILATDPTDEILFKNISFERKSQ